MSLALIAHAGLILLLAAAAILIGRRGRRPELGHLLWVLLFAKLLIPPVLEVRFLPAAPSRAVVSEASSRDELPSLSSTDPESLELDAAMAPVPLGSLEDMTRQGREGASGRARTLLLVLWIVGSLAVAAWTGFGIRRIRRLIRQAVATPEALRELTAELAREAGLARPPRIAVVPARISPAVWPGRRPRLLLPQDLLPRLEPIELEAVLRHELSHLARRDHWVRVLEMIGLCLYWWCPLVWWFRRELRDAEETCCDRRVLRSGVCAPRVYAESLIKTAAVIAAGDERTLPRLATGVSACRSLERRITMIMRFEPSRPLSAATAGALLLAVVGALPLLPARAVTPSDGESDAGHDNPIAVEAPAPAVTPQEVPDEVADTEPALSEAETAAMKEIMGRIQAGDEAAAIRMLEGRITPSGSAVFEFTLGNLHFKKGRLEAAAAAYRGATKKFPAFRRAWKNLGIIHKRRGEFEAACEALRRTIALGGGDGTTYGMLGMALSELGEYAASESAYWMANLKNPGTVDWRMGLINVFFRSKRYAEAISMAETLLAEDPEQPRLHVLMANAYIRLRRPRQAIACLEAAQRFPRGLGARQLCLLGDLCIDAGEYVKGGDAYARALDLDPAASTKRARRALRILIAQGSQDVAASLQRELERKGRPQDGLETLRGRLRLALAEEDVKKQIATLERILALNPNDGEALILRGEVAKKQGDIDGARAWYERAARIDGYRAKAWVRQAQLLVSQGRYEEAAEKLRRAQAVEPNKSVAAYLERIEQLLKRK